MTDKPLHKIRKEYTLEKLNEDEVDKNPLLQFEGWLNDAIKSELIEPNACCLSTSTFNGKPSARMILLKKVSDEGFTFFTNYESRKAQNILQNPYGALTFFWSELERQVRIEGKIEKILPSESDTYFQLRPKGSKLGAWASPQSKEIPNRRYLDSLKADFKEEFDDKYIERPDNWGGYILKPTLIEFWQGRYNRLHDRIEYNWIDGEWKIRRLAP
ncbi:MAG: pyridoxamine 5'-phosphate oxidase [Bacteroidales bacterium]|nr:pyridoxamine 5'-phosphate oxidase [Bacteroidales bacterium]